jgi:hypothetical protein
MAHFEKRTKLHAPEFLQFAVAAKVLQQILSASFLGHSH